MNTPKLTLILCGLAFCPDLYTSRTNGTTAFRPNSQAPTLKFNLYKEGDTSQREQNRSAKQKTPAYVSHPRWTMCNSQIFPSNRSSFSILCREAIPELMIGGPRRKQSPKRIEFRIYWKKFAEYCGINKE
jgi:hypothetical protein